MSLRNMSNKMTVWLMTIPCLIFLIAFHYVPLWGWGMAFLEYIPGLPLTEQPFVGLKHFHTMFALGGEMPRIFTNTLAMALLALAFSPVPAVLAIMLNEIHALKLKKFFQVSLSLPHFISFVIVYSIFLTLFSVDGGLVNEVLLKWNWIDKPTDVLGNEQATWYFQTLVEIWKGAGWSAIIYLAAIAGIDPELYHAASIDGAGRFRKIAHITVPGILPVFSILFVIGIGHILSSNFEKIFVFHNPLVALKIETIDYFVYKVGLTQFNFSLATAMGMVKTIIGLILLFLANYVFRLFSGRSIL